MAFDTSDFEPEKTTSHFDTSDFEPEHQEEAPGFLKSLGADLWRTAQNIGAGGLEMQRDFFNLPFKFVAPFSQSLARKLQWSPETDEQIMQRVGIQNPTWEDKVSQGIAGYAPFVLAGEAIPAAEGSAARLARYAAPGAAIPAAEGLAARLARYAAPGAAYGAITSQNPGIGAATGAVLNVALGGASDAAVGALKSAPAAIKNYLSKYAAEGLANKVGNNLNQVKNLTNAQAFDMAKSNYATHEDVERKAWDYLTKKAREADNTPLYRWNSEYSSPQSQQPSYMNPNQIFSGSQDLSPINKDLMMVNPGKSISSSNVNLPTILQSNLGGQDFRGATYEGVETPNYDNTSYLNALKNKLGILKGQSSRQSGFSRANSVAQSLLSDYLGDTHNSFEDAIEHNKALNKDFQNQITPGQSLPFSTINYAKKKLAENISENIDKNGLQDTLGQAWKNANRATQQKNQLFNTVVSPKGREQISSFLQFIRGNNPLQDPTAFVNDYVPTSRGDGIQKMQQFSMMLGDENAAKNILKMNYFDKVFSDSGDKINPKQFLTKYGDLSEEQQDYLFTPEQNRSIRALTKIRDLNPSALNKGGALSFAGHYVLPSVLGGIGATHLGMHELTGGLAGAAASFAAQKGLSNLFSNPAISNYFVQYLMQAPAAARPSITSPALRQLAAALVAPQVIQRGNQQ